MFLHQERHQSQGHALCRHGADERGQAAAAKGEQIQANGQAYQQIQPVVHGPPPFHAIKRANRHRRKAVMRNSGTRRNARRASSDSTKPTPTVTHSTPPASVPVAAGPESFPRGSTACVSSSANSRSFIAAPCNITAKGGPLWSRTMTSLIIVNSRCVFGSSNGTRQFSANKTMNQLSKTRTSEALAAGQ